MPPLIFRFYKIPAVVLIIFSHPGLSNGRNPSSLSVEVDIGLCIADPNPAK
jgi:hypothetical protein